MTPVMVALPVVVILVRKRNVGWSKDDGDSVTAKQSMGWF
jgi:hypothetical protein